MQTGSKAGRIFLSDTGVGYQKGNQISEHQKVYFKVVIKLRGLP